MQFKKDEDMKQNRRTICIMTSLHKASDVRIFCREANTLAKSNYKVTLIAPGQKKDTECIDNIDIFYFKKPKKRILRMLFSPWSIFITAKRQESGVYHFHDPELIPIGILLRMMGKRVIYDVHEDLPEQMLSKEWLPKNLRKVTSWLAKTIETFTAKHFSAIITTSKKINDRFAEFNPKTMMVRNYPLLQEMAETVETDCSKTKTDALSKTIVSLGGVNSARCAKEIVEAVGLLSDLGINAIIAGACNSNSLFEEIRSLPGWTCTNYCGQLPRPEAMALLKSSRIALIIYSPAPNHYEVRSNRLFESMAAGVPVITSNFMEWKDVVEGTKCGICVDPLNPKAIAGAIRWLIEHPAEAQQMGMNGRKAVEERYNWEMEAGKLRELYALILES